MTTLTFDPKILKRRQADLRLHVNNAGGRVLGCTALTEAGRAWASQVIPFPSGGHSYHDLLVLAGGLQSFGTLVLEIHHEDETTDPLPAA